MTLRSKLFAIVMCGFLSACAGTVSTVVQKDVPIVAPIVQPITTAPVQWQVLTAPQMADLAKKNPKVVLFGLDAANYKNLSLNMVDIKRYLDDQKAVINLYKSVDAQRSSAQTPQTPSTDQGKK